MVESLERPLAIKIESRLILRHDECGEKQNCDQKRTTRHEALLQFDCAACCCRSSSYGRNAISCAPSTKLWRSYPRHASREQITNVAFIRILVRDGSSPHE